MRKIHLESVLCKPGRTHRYIHTGCELLIQRICEILLIKSKDTEDKRFNKIITFQQPDVTTFKIIYKKCCIHYYSVLSGIVYYSE